MKQKKIKPVQSGETDLTALKVCLFDELRITTLDRIKINQMPDKDNLKMLAVAGSRFSCVAALKSRLPVEDLELQVKGGIPCNIYPVESVVFPEEATLLPDLLSEQKTINVAGNTTVMFLLIFDLPKDLKCQDYKLTVTAKSTTHQALSKDFELEIIAPPKPKKIEDHRVIFWPHWKRFSSHFNLELWSEEFWNLAEKYLKEMASGGMNVIMASINHDPFCYPLPEEYYEYNFYPPMVIWKRDKDGNFSFDFSIYDRYVELNLRLGIDKEIECHALLPCKQQDPKIIYHDIESNKIKTIETVHDSQLYKEAWTAFLKAFIDHNRQRGWHDMLTICPYDEPSDPKRFAEVVQLVKRFAPEIKISAAITSGVALSVLDHIDIATIHLDAGYSNEAVEKLRKNGVELRWYNCCAPDWGNTLFNCDFMDSYRISWITEQGNYTGFLRWSIIDWPKAWDTNPGFNWPTGDTYLISPGESGPMETLRWHAYKQGLQDLTLLKQLKTSSKLKEQLSEIGAGHKLYESKTPGEFQQNLYHLIKQENLAFSSNC